MYAQIFFVTSVRGNFFAPQIAASSGLSVFGAKMPLPAAFCAVLPKRFFSAVIFFKAAFVIVVFVVVVVTLTAVFVVVVIAIGGEECTHALSLE